MATLTKPSGDARWNLMFRELKNEVSMPTTAHPAARVWREYDLQKAITKVREQHLAELVSTFPSAKTVIERMLEMGWLRVIPVAEHPAGIHSVKLYLLDMEALEGDQPEPWELLQGYQPDGVLCYFGAAAIHELTTQEPSFHHIAIGQNPAPRKDVDATQSTGDPGKPGKPRDPLGTLAFRFQGVPCYTTRRDKNLMPGIQTREYGPRTQLRITTLEQTMLDALWQPLKSGGESVVFEAWERGVTRWNPDRMAKHLAAINRQDWDRRVGAMLSLLGVEVPSGSLGTLLAARRESWRASTENSPLVLLPGLPGSRLLSEWGILMP
jgi:hypothetical protein